MGQIQGESVLFTQQLAENQQVGIHGTPLTQQQETLTTTTQRRRICRQMIKLIREPVNAGVIPNLFVGSWFCCSTCLTHQHFDHPGAHFQKAIHLFWTIYGFISLQMCHTLLKTVHITMMDGTHFKLENAKTEKHLIVTNLKPCRGNARIVFPIHTLSVTSGI